MELKEILLNFFNKDVMVICKDKTKVVGTLNGYISANDNEPEIDEIKLNSNGMSIGIDVPDIETITEI